MKKYELHSKGTDWFHFRANMGSMIESFSINYCHDGTVCMTGDYGCMCWRRNYDFLPKGADYGFPDEHTYINYFAEKVVRAEEEQVVKTWKRELAISEIKEAIEEYKCEECEKGVEALESVLDSLDYVEDEGNYGYIQMLEVFSELDYQIESEVFCEYGRCYTEMFKIRFKMLKSVSHLILESINETKV